MSADPHVVPCPVPLLSQMDRRFVEQAWFSDAYQAPLRRADDSMVTIFFSLFGHHPWWIKAALIARNRIASLCGLHAPSAREILDVRNRQHYAVGDTIGPWPIFLLTDTELVAGRDNKHLDFRLSIFKEAGAEAASVVVSTVCLTHNVFGRWYLFFVVPFHKWGVQRLMTQAIAAGRL